MFLLRFLCFRVCENSGGGGGFFVFLFLGFKVVFLLMIFRLIFRGLEGRVFFIEGGRF